MQQTGNANLEVPHLGTLRRLGGSERLPRLA